MRKLRIGLALLTLIVLVEIGVLASGRNSSEQETVKASKPSNPAAGFQFGDFKEEQEMWSKRIDEAGAEQAYEQFKEEYKDEHFGLQHSLVHLFGVLLYQKMGIDGVAVCDSTFSFGCYHSFFGVSISGHGIDVIQSLDQACIEKWGEKGLGCPHGIGHGVLTYLGSDALLESLEACATLNWKEPIGGCTSGVFMEYNFRTMEDTNGINLRVLNPEDPHTPCSTLPEQFLQACYFEMPQWWERVYQFNYQKVGALCNELTDKLQYEACFRGMGNTVGPSSKFDVGETIVNCQKMPTYRAQVLCREGASWSFFAQPEYRELAPAVCEGLGEEVEAICNQESDLFGDRQIK